MRVLVCGGRDLKDRGLVYRSLDALAAGGKAVDVIIQGGAGGADYFGRQWAFVCDIDQMTFAADWKAHGRAAGPIRNEVMLTEGRPDVVVAFPGGRGTADMVRRANAAGVRVVEVTYDSARDSRRMVETACGLHAKHD